MGSGSHSSSLWSRRQKDELGTAEGMQMYYKCMKGRVRFESNPALDSRLPLEYGNPAFHNWEPALRGEEQQQWYGDQGAEMTAIFSGARWKRTKQEWRILPGRREDNVGRKRSSATKWPEMQDRRKKSYKKILHCQQERAAAEGISKQPYS